jgi:N-acetylmuramic acid 6-phosphate etherase
VADAFARYVLGLEGGATHSTAVLLDSDGTSVQELRAGPLNLQLQDDACIVAGWHALAAKLIAPPGAVGAFLAGCATAAEQHRVKTLVATVWPAAMAVAGSDIQASHTAAFDGGGQGSPVLDADGILLVCGTGAAAWGQRGDRSCRQDGWGHVAGDLGSGYWMGHEALRAAFRQYDRAGKPTALCQWVLEHLGINTMRELTAWSLTADKAEIAALCPLLFEHRRQTDVKGIIQNAADALADTAVAAAKRLRWRHPRIAVNNGIAAQQPAFLRLIRAATLRLRPGATVELAGRPGCWGAARRAQALLTTDNVTVADSATPATPAALLDGRALQTSPTEQRNPRSAGLDRKTTAEIVDVMLAEETRTVPAIRRQRDQLVAAVEMIGDSLAGGGRLFYIGAGTSGRLGVLDAAECPPTFGCPQSQIQGIIAGGQRALYQSAEGAEDDAGVGHRVINERRVEARDAVVGIAASGSTPFVLGGLAAAHAIGARTILVTFNPSAPFTLPGDRFLKLAVETGPEIVTGSTRLKAGTATKLILNIFSTVNMVRLGKVVDNLMADLDPSCIKLHDRMIRIYMELSGLDYAAACQALEAVDWKLRDLLN